jgi:SAM-dependent methyltransferase
MPDWQERITRDTKPSIRVEHDLRYAAAAPIVRGSSAWADLGCGAGVAAADALGDEALGRVILVDADADALDQAGRDLRARETVRVEADLSTEAGVAAVRAALGDTPGVITCFEVIEHLESFVPLVDALVELAAAGWTVVLSVPNDAFWALENPYHHTMWGEGAFDELRRLLPADAAIAHQVPLDGSHLVLETFAGVLDVPAVAPRADAVPSHFIAAFGPQAGLLASRALAIPSDLDGRRTWERQRESTLAVLEAELEELRAYVRWASDEFARLNAPAELREQTPETVARPES